MDFTAFDYLTGLEKRKVRWVFRGWKTEYLESLEFLRVSDGWMLKDRNLRAIQYMHYGSNGGQSKNG